VIQSVHRQGFSPAEFVIFLGAFFVLVAIALAPAHRTLGRAKQQAQTIRHWDPHNAQMMEWVNQRNPAHDSTLDK
jgi:hypothetical protein